MREKSKTAPCQNCTATRAKLFGAASLACHPYANSQPRCSSRPGTSESLGMDHRCNCFTARLKSTRLTLNTPIKFVNSFGHGLNCRHNFARGWDVASLINHTKTQRCLEEGTVMKFSQATCVDSDVGTQLRSWSKQQMKDTGEKCRIPSKHVASANSRFFCCPPCSLPLELLDHN